MAKKGTCPGGLVQLSTYIVFILTILQYIAQALAILLLAHNYNSTMYTVKICSNM